jgi:predicted lysophospholipase L1 biosynthesis ABC-type transport system permease subunit
MVINIAATVVTIASTAIGAVVIISTTSWNIGRSCHRLSCPLRLALVTGLQTKGWNAAQYFTSQCTARLS